MSEHGHLALPKPPPMIEIDDGIAWIGDRPAGFVWPPVNDEEVERRKANRGDVVIYAQGSGFVIEDYWGDD